MSRKYINRIISVVEAEISTLILFDVSVFMRFLECICKSVLLNLQKKKLDISMTQITMVSMIYYYGEK